MAGFIEGVNGTLTISEDDECLELDPVYPSLGSDLQGQEEDVDGDESGTKYRQHPVCYHQSRVHVECFHRW